MSHSKPFDLVNFLYRPVWESFDGYKGNKYRPTKHDLRDAKEFLAMNPDIFDEDGLVEFQEHAQEFLKSKFEGWLTLKHPCWAFLGNYNTYAPKKVVVQVKRKLMIHCINCGDNHGAHDKCTIPMEAGQ